MMESVFAQSSFSHFQLFSFSKEVPGDLDFEPEFAPFDQFAGDLGPSQAELPQTHHQAQ